MVLFIKYPLPVSPNSKESFGTKLCLERFRPQVCRQEKHKVFLHVSIPWVWFTLQTPAAAACQAPLQSRAYAHNLTGTYHSLEQGHPGRRLGSSVFDAQFTH